MNDVFLDGKLELNKTQHSKTMAIVLREMERPKGLGATREWGSQPGLKAQTGDTAFCRGHIEWSTKLLELGLEPKESFCR